MITASLNWYARMNVAYIEKTPEPMKPLGKPNRSGQFLACYTKQGQPDFKGTITGGRSVVFEAKQTDTDRITYDRLTDKQIEVMSIKCRNGEQLVKELSGCREVHHTIVGCTISSHCGPRCLGVLFIEG